MRSLVRCVLIWLMALAMPVQGIAAVGMQHCASTHERMHATAVAAMPSDHHEHSHVATSDVDAHTAATPQHGTSAAGSDDAGLAKTHAALDAGTCSACAACCAALGLPSSTVQVPVAPMTAMVPQCPVPEVASFVTGSLDRPPSPILA